MTSSAATHWASALSDHKRLRTYPCSFGQIEGEYVSASCRRGVGLWFGPTRRGEGSPAPKRERVLKSTARCHSLKTKTQTAQADRPYCPHLRCGQPRHSWSSRR